MGFDFSGSVLKKYTEEPDVEKVVIPIGITTIECMAMRFNCDHIKEIIIPEGVTRIGYKCFSHSKALEKVTLPESLIEVEDGLFFNCPKLRMVNIPGSVKTIKSRMFSNCSSLKEIVIPEGVEEIGFGAFAECKALKKVVLPSSLKTIKGGAFRDCAKLESINITDDIQISDGAFGGCKSLNNKAEYVIVREELCGYNGDGKKVDIPENVKVISGSVFRANKKIVDVHMPDSIERITEEAFKGCSNLQRIRISSGIGSIKAAMFWDCKALEEVKIPEGITIIEENAFRHCYAIKIIRLPYSVKTIEKKAFSGTRESASTDISTIIIAPGTNIERIISPEDRFAAAIGYLREPDLYEDETVIQSYRTYISKKKILLLPLIWKYDMSQAFRVFAENGLLTKKTFEEFLFDAHKNNAMECVAFLMDWKNGINTGTVHEVKKKSFMDTLVELRNK